MNVQFQLERGILKCHGAILSNEGSKQRGQTFEYVEIALDKDLLDD